MLLNGSIDVTLKKKSKIHSFIQDERKIKLQQFLDSKNLPN